jgi:hypothetical protein
MLFVVVETVKKLVSINLLIFVIKGGVLFQVRTRFLNMFYMSFSFGGLSRVNKLILVMMYRFLFEARAEILKCYLDELRLH